MYIYYIHVECKYYIKCWEVYKCCNKILHVYIAWMHNGAMSVYSTTMIVVNPYPAGSETNKPVLPV